VPVTRSKGAYLKRLRISLTRTWLSRFGWFPEHVLSLGPRRGRQPDSFLRKKANGSQGYLT
jgi:hypothetical protein